MIRAFAASCCLVLLCCGQVRAQSMFDFDLSQLDPSRMLAATDAMLLGAADPQVDALYQAVLASSQLDREAASLCRVFDIYGDHSLAGLQRAVTELGPESRERFTLALTGIAVSGFQRAPRTYDAAEALQVIKAAGVTAAILHDGFLARLNAEGDDPASRDGRCQAFRQVIGVLADFSLEERALATRHLLREGFGHYGQLLSRLQ